MYNLKSIIITLRKLLFFCLMILSQMMNK